MPRTWWTRNRRWTVADRPAHVLTRREFIASTGAALASAAASGAAQTSRYDLVIKGGRVIDPAARLDAVRDVAIAGGRIAAITPSIPADAADMIDARGKLVVPGLLDIHTHVGRYAEGPQLVL